jgi:hypothetical protein
MSQSSSPPPSPRPLARPPNWRRVLSGVVRGLLVVGVCLAGWQLLVLYHDLFTTRPKHADPAPEAATPSGPALQLLQADFWAPGRWSVGDSSLVVQMVQGSSAEVQHRLQALGDTPPRIPRLSALESELLHSMRRLAEPAGREQNYRIYRLQWNETVGRVVTEGEGNDERIRLGQLAWPESAHEWSLVELRPLPGSAGELSEGGHLLPLPAGSESLARRWTPSGRCVGELVGQAGRLEALVDDWQREGWEVQGGNVQTEWGRGVRCRKGNIWVQVWNFTSRTPLEHYLLLIVLPSDRDGGPVDKGKP